MGVNVIVLRRESVAPSGYQTVLLVYSGLGLSQGVYALDRLPIRGDRLMAKVLLFSSLQVK